MPDSTDPIPPVTPTPVTAAGPGTSSTGLPSNVAAALACIPLVGGVIFFVLEKRDSFVRFYAMQSIIFGGAWIIFWLVWAISHAILTPIPAIGPIFGLILWLIWALVWIAFLIVFIIAVIKAFTGVRWDIPYIGPMARQQVDGTTVL